MSTRSTVRTRVPKRGRKSASSLKKRKPRPVWEEILRIARTIPEPDLHKLPTDLAAHHDHYLYGSKGT
uniref:hypothetical protein n=1 Tax=Nitrospira cf. moscoviensis SBR1015 TaxID=96242 RepID=UPI0011236D73|nr:hypothetical protein [Nitrospira cf. moscoviensis SBR1015]